MKQWVFILFSLFILSFQATGQEICNNSLDDDGDGLIDCADCADCANAINCTDTDNDGIPDACDEDDDNDGISDVDEGCGTTDFPNADKGYLFQGNPICTVYTVDIQTGVSNQVGTLPFEFNAVTVNEADGYFWGISKATTELKIINPNTLVVVNSIPFPRFCNSAAYDPIRKLYVVNRSDRVYVVDADPSSPDYTTIIDDFPVSRNVVDIVYNSGDGFMYGVEFSTDNLIKFDIENQVLTDMGDVPNLPVGVYGANYSTLDGRMFFSENTTGNIYLINLSTGFSASFFVNGPTSGFNDGAKLLAVDLDGNPLCIDTDGDGMTNNLDLDSDNDLCPDAIEGGGNFTYANVQNNKLPGNVDFNGIPVVANGGQSVGVSQYVSIMGCVEDCVNGIDDDHDGLFDCADVSDCVPNITDVTVIQPTCADKTSGKITIFVTNSGILEYSITNEPTWQSSNTFPNLGIGQYTIRVRNDSGCESAYTSNPVVLELNTCVEICNNGIDDDGDGDVDCDDSDCKNIPTASSINNN